MKRRPTTPTKTTSNSTNHSLRMSTAANIGEKQHLPTRKHKRSNNTMRARLTRFVTQARDSVLANNRRKQHKQRPNDSNLGSYHPTGYVDEAAFAAKRPSSLSLARTSSSLPSFGDADDDSTTMFQEPEPVVSSDKWNYALLIVLYTLQGIPMGLSASIPFLLQEKISKVSQLGSLVHTTTATTNMSPSIMAAETLSAQTAAAASYQANAMFALCSWPFSLKLLWAPIVDAIYCSKFGRRKSWLVPVQAAAGLLLVTGANFVERQLGLNPVVSGTTTTMNVKGVTAYFFFLYLFMATQDIAVDGWALTMLQPHNRGKGPLCNSIGQNIGYFLSFVGFLSLHDVDSCNRLWRPLLGLPFSAEKGMVTLKGFLRTMGIFMLITTAFVAIFKRELPQRPTAMPNTMHREHNGNDEDEELDASQLGLKETYHRLWAVCQLPAVKWLFLLLVTYRLPTALSDNVKFLKAVELGLSKSTTALLSPTLILPLGILVPILATKIWHMEPLRQFIRAYEWRVTLIPLLDLWMLHRLASGQSHDTFGFWLSVILSTAGQAITNSLQFNAQMTFFASRVDPAIGGSYMTLLNTAANLGGTWPASFVMELLAVLTKRQQRGNQRTTTINADGSFSSSSLSFWQDPYVLLQMIFSVLGLIWIVMLGPTLKTLAKLPDDAWRTHILEDRNNETKESIHQHKRAATKKTTVLQSTPSMMESGEARTTTTTDSMRNYDNSSMDNASIGNATDLSRWTTGSAPPKKEDDKIE